MTTLIRNYGLFWSRNEVVWGGRGKNNAGSLLGLWSVAKKSKPVDFRCQRGIYLLYDDAFRLVYVGQAGAKDRYLFERLRDRTKDDLAHRWSRFSWFGTKPVTDNYDLGPDEAFQVETSDVLNHLEAILIASAEPPLNRQGGRFGDSERYLQVPQSVDPTKAITVENLKEIDL